MRIAMFMPALGPNALGWKIHLDFAAAVEQLGHGFSLYTTPRAGDSVAAAGTNGENAATVLPAPGALGLLAELGRPLLRTRNFLPAAAALGRHLRRHGGDIDLLHLEVAYPHAAAAAAAVAASGWSGPMAITPMGEDFLIVEDRGYGMRRYSVPSRLVNWTLRRAAALRCISPLAETHIAALSPNNPRRVIPLNISSEVAAAATWSAAQRASFRAQARRRCDRDFGTAGRPIVLSFGRLHPFKGIDYLIDAATGIGDATILVIGPSLTVKGYGDIAATLRAHADKLGVADKVNIAGGVPPDRALEILAAADVVVVPSPLESLNKVCVEAAAVGTPFVVTETTGIAAWVDEQPIGIVVPPRNPAAISWAIEEILDEHFAFDGAAAAQFARQFAPAPIAARVMEFYEEVLGVPSASG